MAIGTPTSLGTPVNVGSGVSSATLTTSAAVVAGNLLVAAVTVTSATARTVSSISDGTNSYTFGTSFTEASGQTDCELWYCLNAAAKASGASLVCTLSGAETGGSIKLQAAQVSGVATVSGLDKTAANGTGAGTTVTATTSTLSSAPEIAFGASYLNIATTYSGASGFTNIDAQNASSSACAFDYQQLSSTSAVSYSPTWPSSTIVLACVLTFKGGGVTHNQAVSITQASSVSVLKAVGKTLSMTEASTVSVLKVVGKHLSITEASTVTMKRSVGKIVSITEASTVTMKRAMTKLVLITESSSVHVTKAISHSFSITQAATVHVTKSVGKIVTLTTEASMVLIASAYSALRRYVVNINVFRSFR